MTLVPPTAEFQAQLEALTEPTEVVSADGRFLGRFVPLDIPEHLLRPPTDEELSQIRAANGKDYTTQEVLRHLESL